MDTREMQQQSSTSTPRLVNTSNKQAPNLNRDTAPTVDSKLKRYIDNEGWRINPYVDTEGYVTGGIGHKFTDSDFKNWDSQWSDDEKVSYWTDRFDEDTATSGREAIADAAKFKVEPTSEQIDILAELKFNMGSTRFNAKKWKNFYKAMDEGNVGVAADELLKGKDGGKSLWYQQVKGRAKKIADQLRNS